MPQATDDLRKLMCLLFVPGWDRETTVITEQWPSEYLKSKGWVMTHKFLWYHPDPNHHTGEIEVLCLNYLVEEWDYEWTTERIKY